MLVEGVSGKVRDAPPPEGHCMAGEEGREGQ